MSQYISYKNLGNDQSQSNHNSYKCDVVKSIEHKQSILSSTKIVVIDIHGDWCEPCKKVSPVFEQMAQDYNTKYAGQVYLCKEDVDLNFSPDCTGVPMFAFFVNGVNVKNIMGGDMKQVKESLDGLITGTLSQ